MLKVEQSEPVLGSSDRETVKIDCDGMPFRVVKKLARIVMEKCRLDGFVILRSSRKHYHVVFNRPVSWSENMHIVAWVSLLSGNEKMKTYFLMQCIKQSSTLRVSSKGEKPSPRIVFRFGEQDKQVKEFLSYRREIKRIIRKMRNRKQENIEAR